MKKNQWLGINLMALVCLTGFFKENPVDEMSSYISEKEVSIRPNPNLDLGELPQEQQYVPLNYTGKISPFELKGFVYPKELAGGEQVDSEKCPDGVCGEGPEPHAPYFLEGYELMELQMVGTIGRPTGNGGSIVKPEADFKALMKTPNAGIIFAKPGEYIGRNNGKVEAIGFQDMKLKEKHRVSRGWQDKEETIKILN